MERTHLKGTTGSIVREHSAFQPMQRTPDTCVSPATYSALSPATRARAHMGFGCLT